MNKLFGRKKKILLDNKEDKVAKQKGEELRVS